MRSMRDHGAAMSDFQRHHGSKPYLLAEHPFAGYNYRMTDISAAIGREQLKKLSKFMFSSIATRVSSGSIFITISLLDLFGALNGFIFFNIISPSSQFSALVNTLD